MNDESELRYIEERKNLRLHEIKSLIAVPVTYDNRLYGFAGFNSIKNSYHYSELEQNLLQNFGQLLLSLMLRKEIEDSVYIKKEIFRTTLLSIADGVVSVDNEQNIILMNEAAEKLSGISYREAQGKPVSEVLNFMHEGASIPCSTTVERVIKTGITEKISDDVLLVHRDGLQIPVQHSISAVKNKKNDTKGAVVIIRDVTSERNIQKQAEYLSFHDHLTDLYNRRFFEEELLRLDTLRNLPLSVIMIDVNGLKLTNDAFGHETGDRLLKKVAGLMKKECRNDDIVARLGGDEFSVILPKTDAVQTKLIMDRITGSADKENLKSIVISVAAGYATKTSPDQNIDEIIKIAENNMYSDKINTGKRMRRKTFELITVNLFEKYSYEQDQSERMKKLAARIGSAMGLSKDQISTLETISYYHDIGKIIIPPRLLNRPSDLSLEEYDLVQRHVEAGYQIMKSQEEYSSIAIYVLSHHERWDGNGYPRKQKGHEIPLLSRILAVLDAYTAMTGNLPYKKSLSTDSAIMELKKNAGLQFDPEVVDIFTGILLEEEI